MAKRNILVLLLALDVLLAGAVAVSKANQQAMDSAGSALVKAMYEFDSPAQFVAKQELVHQMLTEEEWERLQADNDLRMVNTYYKFQFSPTRVNILQAERGYVLYQLVNDYIDPNECWVLLYNFTGDKLTNIREYHLLLSRGSDVFGHPI